MNNRFKIKSRQWCKPDCMLRSLVNIGVCSSYTEAFELNKQYADLFATLSGKSINEVKAIHADRLGRTWGLFPHVGFIAWVLNKKYIPFNETCKTRKKIKSLKNFTGIVFIEHKTTRHAIAIQYNHVFDSHRKYSIPIDKYRYQDIVAIFGFSS